MLPAGTFGCPGVSLPGAVSVSCVPTSSSMKAGCASIQASVVQQQATSVVQKRNQIKATDVNNTLLLKPKIQEDLIIAREIVINDADPAMRYKLTKRQTQEEIQKCTGAVVITRGKYRPPKAVPDGEKPLYLHISAGAQLTETVERILAVDRAAAMVEDMLKQVSQPLSACIYLGFDADPSLNIVSRIYGPNDQYINHIKNETGTTVVLRGRGSGYLRNTQEGHQPLHLLLSSNNQKSLEDAKLLADNLLDTISRECGANRVSSCKVYNAVPPPQQLLVGVQSSGIDLHLNLSSAESMACSGATLMPGPPLPSVVVPVVPTAVSCGQVMQPGASLALGHALANDFPYSQPHLTACTSYSAYAGIYPQATPLQQVTLGRRKSGPVSSTVSPAAAASKVMPKCSSESEKRKRKFQESSAAFKGVAASQQESQLQDLFPSSMEKKKKYSVFLPPSLKDRLPHPSSSSSTTSLASRSMPLLQDSVKDMLPSSPLPKSTQPPPHPKFVSSVSVSTVSDKDNISNRSSSPSVSEVSDTLVKLREYGEDGDDDECENESCKNIAKRVAPSKPFWAV